MLSDEHFGSFSIIWLQLFDEHLDYWNIFKNVLNLISIFQYNKTLKQVSNFGQKCIDILFLILPCQICKTSAHISLTDCLMKNSWLLFFSTLYLFVQDSINFFHSFFLHFSLIAFFSTEQKSRLFVTRGKKAQSICGIYHYFWIHFIT